MYNLESVLENETHKILWDLDIQTDNLISNGPSDQIIVNKIQRICQIVDFTVLADNRAKLKEEK